MIIKILTSDKPNKRYKIIMNNNKTYDFGYKYGNTYIDHHNKLLRYNYMVRHYNLIKERPFIDNIIPSPSLFSFYILWGPFTDIYDNINYLNNLLNKKYNE
jgi:hypothetical protein